MPSTAAEPKKVGQASYIHTRAQSSFEPLLSTALGPLAVGVPASASIGGAARLETVAGALAGAALSSLTCLSVQAISVRLLCMLACPAVNLPSSLILILSI